MNASVIVLNHLGPHESALLWMTWFGLASSIYSGLSALDQNSVKFRGVDSYIFILLSY